MVRSKGLISKGKEKENNTVKLSKNDLVLLTWALGFLLRLVPDAILKESRRNQANKLLVRLKREVKKSR